MNYTLGHVLDELEDILTKKAEAQLSAPGNPGPPGNVLGGDTSATDGAGRKLPGGVQAKQDMADLTDCEDPQHENQGATTTEYQSRALTSSKDKQQHTGLNQGEVSHQTKASEVANRILSNLNYLLGTSQGAEKQSGEKLAESTLRRIVQEELHKVAMPEEGMDYEDDDYEKRMDKKKKKKSDEDDDYEDEDMEEGEEKMSAHEWQEYQLAKQAGARAAVEFLNRLTAGQQQAGPTQWDMQKQAAYQDYLLSKQAGANLAEQTIRTLLESNQSTEKAAEYAGYTHPAQAPDPNDSYNEMLKFASHAGIDPEVLHTMLTSMYRDQQLGGTPHPFVGRDHIKSSADVGPLFPILSGLLQEGTISQAEKAAILDYIASAESLSEEELRKATKDVSEQDAVLKRMLAGDLQEHQRNANKAPSPEPSMPLTQPSPSAMNAEELGDVSQSDIPGSLEEHMKESALSDMVIEASLRSALQKIESRRSKR